MTVEKDSEEIYEEQHKRILSDVSNLFVLLNPPQTLLASVLSLWQMGCAIPMHPEVLVSCLYVNSSPIAVSFLALLSQT